MTKVHVRAVKPSPELQRDVEALLVVLVDSAKHANVPLTVDSLEGLDWAHAAEIAIVPMPSPATIEAVVARVRSGRVHKTHQAVRARSQREHKRGLITLEEALETEITFGKNKGVKLKNLTIRQLEWYATECYFEDIRTAAGLVLELRDEERLKESNDHGSFPYEDDYGSFPYDKGWWE